MASVAGATRSRSRNQAGTPSSFEQCPLHALSVGLLSPPTALALGKSPEPLVDLAPCRQTNACAWDFYGASGESWGLQEASFSQGPKAGLNAARLRLIEAWQPQDLWGITLVLGLLGRWTHRRLQGHRTVSMTARAIVHLQFGMKSRGSGQSG